MHYFYFFSSRRRHTRWPRDWSSDVCSSDLSALARLRGAGRAAASNRRSTRGPATAAAGTAGVGTRRLGKLSRRLPERREGGRLRSEQSENGRAPTRFAGDRKSALRGALRNRQSTALGRRAGGRFATDSGFGITSESSPRIFYFQSALRLFTRVIVDCDPLFPPLAITLSWYPRAC